MNEMITLTPELIKAGLNYGSINQRQAQLFGLSRKDLTNGWIDRMAGHDMPKADYDKYLSLRKQKNNINEPSKERVKLDKRMLLSVSDDGRFSRRQIEMLGGKWPVESGWIESIMGSTITKKTFNELMAFKPSVTQQVIVEEEYQPPF